jgi:hypothetical protein
MNPVLANAFQFTCGDFLDGVGVLPEPNALFIKASRLLLFWRLGGVFLAGDLNAFSSIFSKLSLFVLTTIYI